MKSKIFILLFLSKLLYGSYGFEAKACGYIELPEEIRMMMFRAQLPEMKALQMFYYTPNEYYTDEPDPQQNDRFRNCVEWQNQLGKSVSWDDIYVILYKTEPNEFIEAYNNGQLKTLYPKNTFVEQLSIPSNKNCMDYLLLAKKVESTERSISGGRFESWDSIYGEADETSYTAQKRNYYLEASKYLTNAKNTFLKERYAYQVCRLGYQLKKYADVEQTYDTYFKELKPESSLMNVWSLLFKAISIDVLGQKQEANQLYALVFDRCDEKKFRCIQLFNGEEDIPFDIDAHLQGVMYVMQMINYPGKALDSLKVIYNLDAESAYLPFLIMREINKLEDWIFTPEYYVSNYGADHCYEQTAESNEQTMENLRTDLQYLDSLKNFVTVLRENAQQDKKDFYSMALAHLSLMQENDSEAQKYLSSIPKKAAPGILLQKKLENVWLAIHTQNISKPAFKDYFVQHIAALQNLSVENFDNNKMLYSLTLKLSKEYLKKNDIVTADLLQMKSEYYRTFPEEYYYYRYYQDYYYQVIQQFDMNASVADIDQLIALLSNNKKSKFELFLCDQPIGSIDAYKDLKGTLAFRKNDLKTAYETFASMPQDFWEKTYEFATYLNEDPFFPKGLKKKRDFTYRFNKTDFVKTLLDLEEGAKKDKNLQAANYLKLGNAFFNCSYWGNSWMMTSYSQSILDVDFDKPNCASDWEIKNYYTCDRAASYYKKALESDATQEEKAFATLMLYKCNFLKYFYSNTYAKEKNAAREYALAFNSTFKNTQTFKDFSCPGINNFLAGKIPEKE
ncbi:MAG: hypothetical protein FWF52_01790 [Candidatus Azobacteroides sp.]|nr:hypothetical protein [Candidatus Azobacteroides sp.]